MLIRATKLLELSNITNPPTEMTLNDLFLISLLALLGYGIWQHLNISALAKKAARRHCEQSGVQFLDQNVVLKSLSFCRSPHSVFSLKRTYQFEFSSTGDSRYYGHISLIGNRVDHIELPPCKTPIQ